MEFYTLDDTFQRDEIIDEFDSAIWTERYIPAGDMQIILPATPERVVQLQEGKHLALVGSDEIMIIETQSIEEGLMTVKGQSLEVFLNERNIRTSGNPNVKVWKITNTPGGLIAKVVQEMLIASPYLDDAITAGNIYMGGAANRIPNLALGVIEPGGVNITENLPFGPIYDAILPIATKHQLGMSMTLVSVDPFDYDLEFKVYKGLDRTTGQVQNDLVQFSPALETMSDVKELRSIVGYRTVAYAYPPEWSTAWYNPGVAYQPGVDPADVGFKRRVLMLTADITEDMLGPNGTAPTIQSLLLQRAKDALANNNFTKLLDGEVVPQGYIYGEHYGLGDIVELVGQSGVPQDARVTEFVRSQDSTGERGYPTVSVID